MRRPVPLILLRTVRSIVLLGLLVATPGAAAKADEALCKAYASAAVAAVNFAISHKCDVSSNPNRWNRRSEDHFNACTFWSKDPRNGGMNAINELLGRALDIGNCLAGQAGVNPPFKFSFFKGDDAPTLATFCAAYASIASAQVSQAQLLARQAQQQVGQALNECKFTIPRFDSDSEHHRLACLGFNDPGTISANELTGRAQDVVACEVKVRSMSAGGATGAAGGGAAGGPGIFSNKIVQFAIDHLGQFVGDGQCTALVSAALDFAGAPPGDFSSPIGDYVWGTQKINFPADPAQPGDIIQLVNAKLTGPNGFWETATQHSAIIESASGTLLHLLDQNAPPGNPVAREDINLGWTLDRGSYSIYRPVAAGIKGLVARKAAVPARPLAASVSMTRIAAQAVDVYAAPGGVGQPAGSVKAKSTVTFTAVRPGQWCHVSGAIVPQGSGWVFCGKGFELR